MEGDHRQSAPPTSLPAITEDRIFMADQATFKELVQRLTGQPAAAGSSSATVQEPRSPIAVWKPPAFKPTHQRRPSNVSGVRPARVRLSSLVSPMARSLSSSSSSSGMVEGACVLNKKLELPPSPPPASTLPEETVVDEAAGEMVFDPAVASSSTTARSGEPPQLLNLFPLTPSYSTDES